MKNTQIWVSEWAPIFFILKCQGHTEKNKYFSIVVTSLTQIGGNTFLNICILSYSGTRRNPTMPNCAPRANLLSPKSNSWSPMTTYTEHPRRRRRRRPEPTTPPAATLSPWAVSSSPPPPSCPIRPRCRASTPTNTSSRSTWPVRARALGSPSSPWTAYRSWSPTAISRANSPRP